MQLSSWKSLFPSPELRGKQVPRRRPSPASCRQPVPPGNPESPGCLPGRRAADVASSLGHHGRAWGSSKEPSWEGTVCAELPGPLPASNRLSLGAFWAGGCPAPTVIWPLGTWTLQGLHSRAPQQPCFLPFFPEKPGVAGLGTHLVWVRAEEGDPGYSGVHGSPQSLCSRARPSPLSWPPPPTAENRLGVSVGDLRAPEQEGPRSHLAHVQRADEYPEAQGREGGVSQPHTAGW